MVPDSDWQPPLLVHFWMEKGSGLSAVFLPACWALAAATTRAAMAAKKNLAMLTDSS